MHKEMKDSRWLRPTGLNFVLSILCCMMLTNFVHAQTNLADIETAASVDKSAAYTTETITLTAVASNLGNSPTEEISVNLEYLGILESIKQMSGTTEIDIPLPSGSNYFRIDTLSTLEAGETTTFTITLKPEAGFSYAYLFINGNVNESNYNNNTAVVPIMGLTDAPVDFQVTGYARNGVADYERPLLRWYTFQPFLFEVLVTNLSDSEANSVTIANTITPGFEIDHTNIEIITGSATGVVQNGTTVTLASMSPGASCKIQFFGQAILGGNIKNLTQVTCESQPELPVRQSEPVVIIKAVKNCDLSVVFDPLDGISESGTVETFTAHVTNSGPDDADMVPVSIFVPKTKAWDVLSADNNGAISKGYPNSSMIYWSFPLNSGETKTISFQARALGRGKVRSFGFSLPKETDEYFDPNPAGNSSSIDTEIVGGPQFDLVSSSIVSSDKIQLDGLFVHTMTVTNNGPDDATSITLHSSFAFSPFGTGQSFDLISIEDAGRWDIEYLGEHTIHATLPYLAADESATITAVLKFAFYVGYGNISVDFIVLTPVSDLDETNNIAGAFLTLATEADPGADLFITRTANPDPGVINQNLTYTVRGLNLGPDPTTTAYIGNILPKGCTLVSATADKGTVNVNGKYVDVSDIPLAVGEAATLTMDVVPNQAGYITNHSGLSSADFDPDLNNNITTIDTQILETPECAEAVDLSAHLSKIQSRGKFKKKTGEWQFKVNTKVETSNNGTQCAPPTVVKLYLSDDPFIDESDTLLDTQSVKTVCPSKKPRKVKFKVKLGNDQNPVGRYIIAVADGDNIVPECNEENNMAAGF